MTAAEKRRVLEAVREAIEGSGIQPAEIARRSGIDKAALSRFLRGDVGLSIESIEKLAPVLGLQIIVKKKESR